EVEPALPDRRHVVHRRGVGVRGDEADPRGVGAEPDPAARRLLREAPDRGPERLLQPRRQAPDDGLVLLEPRQPVHHELRVGEGDVLRLLRLEERRLGDQQEKRRDGVHPTNLGTGRSFMVRRPGSAPAASGTVLITIATVPMSPWTPPRMRWRMSGSPRMITSSYCSLTAAWATNSSEIAGSPPRNARAVLRRPMTLPLGTTPRPVSVSFSATTASGGCSAAFSISHPRPAAIMLIDSSRPTWPVISPWSIFWRNSATVMPVPTFFWNGIRR